MSDIQNCIASFVVASGAQSENAEETVDRAIEAYLADTPENPLQAIVALKTAFEEMMLDGRVAAHISSRIDQALTSQLQLGVGGHAHGRPAGTEQEFGE